jgi:beta-glucanase (GH16 family)
LLCACAIWLAVSALIGHPVRAADVLTNPGFELDGPAGSAGVLGWNTYGRNVYNETSPFPGHAGARCLKVYQEFTGAINYSGVYQDNISGAGAVYAGNGRAFCSALDLPAGKNAAWLEVTFRDPAGRVLALYRSAQITADTIATGAFAKNSWVDLPVTNQYDPGTFAMTNTTPALVAPAGTSFVRFQVTFQGDAANSRGSVYFDDLTLIQNAGGPYGDWRVVWSDEFNGPAINTNIWTFDLGNKDGWGNHELEYYTRSPDNAYVSDGLLHIVARQQSARGFSFTSARMKTQGLYSATYGRFEFRASLPAGAGFWPAIWMLGTNITQIGWPKCGEIDIVENKGSDLAFVQGSLHSGSDETQVYTLPGGSVTNFHTYVLEWTPNAISWYVDGLRYETQTNWSGSAEAYPAPFNQPFFIIMNLAVGGDYVGNPNVSRINRDSNFPGEMQVDYVRVYNLAAPRQMSAAVPRAPAEH